MPPDGLVQSLPIRALAEATGIPQAEQEKAAYFLNECVNYQQPLLFQREIERICCFAAAPVMVNEMSQGLLSGPGARAMRLKNMS